MALLRVHYKFDETDFNTVVDHSPENNTGLIRGNVGLLLHFNGANNSTSFVDSSYYLHTVTAVGTAKITSSAKLGSGALLLDGGGYLSIPRNFTFDLNDTGFGLEAWIYIDSASSGNRVIAGCGELDGSTNGWAVYVNSSQQLVFVGKFAGAPFYVPSTLAAPIDEWAHVSVSRTTAIDKYYFAINGSVELIATGQFRSITRGTAGFCVGATPLGAGKFVGKIDELRYLSGHWERISAFTPPSVELTEGSPTRIVGYDQGGVNFVGRPPKAFGCERVYSQDLVPCDYNTQPLTFYCRFKTTEGGANYRGMWGLIGYDLTNPVATPYLHAGFLWAPGGKVMLAGLLAANNQTPHIRGILSDDALNDGEWHEVHGITHPPIRNLGILISTPKWYMWVDGEPQSGNGTEETEPYWYPANALNVRWSAGVGWITDSDYPVSQTQSFIGDLDDCMGWCGEYLPQPPQPPHKINSIMFSCNT